jgi:hypothetical protein
MFVYVVDVAITTESSQIYVFAIMYNYTIRFNLDIK